MRKETNWYQQIEQFVSTFTSVTKTVLMIQELLGWEEGPELSSHKGWSVAES